jgi:signal transduction histidine kinase
MRQLIKIFSLCAMSFCLSAPTWAAGDRASREDAVNFVGKAVAFLKANGEEKAFAAFSQSEAEKGKFVERELYIFVYDTKGFMHAIGNGNAKKMVGKGLIDFRDADGVYLVQGLIKATEATGKGWFDYKFPNQITKVIEAKSGYCERVGDKLICSGIYRQ